MANKMKSRRKLKQRSGHSGNGLITSKNGLGDLQPELFDCAGING